VTILSASAVPRILACPTSIVLPQRAYHTAWADQGSVRHAAREVAADLRDLSGLPPVVAQMIRPSDRLLTEHVFTYDAVTGTARHVGPLARDLYHTLNLGPFEFPGKPDLVIAAEDRVVVVDHKGFEEVEAAESNRQTATYALMVARALGVDEVIVVIAYEIRRPSIATLEALDLDAHAAALRQMFVDVAAARMNPGRYLAIGPHCKYCEAFHDCPLQKALIVDVESGLISMRVEDPFSDDEEAQWALDLLGEIKLIQTRIHAALAARATARPIPLRDGQMWGPRETLGSTKLDASIVYEVVRELHGAPIAEIAAPRKATQKAIREALEFVDGDPKALLEVVKARGGSKRDTTTTIEAYEPGPRLVAGDSS
jgi:hypothetical protein